MDAAPPPSAPEEPPALDWSLLPLDALASVFVRLGAVDVLMGAGLVCRSWLQAANLPDVWRVVDMENPEVLLKKDTAVLRAMARAAVDRSGGQLRVFAGNRFVTDEILKYIVESSPLLEVLLVRHCFDTHVPAERVRPSKFPGIKIMTLDCGDKCWCYNYDLVIGYPAFSQKRRRPLHRLVHNTVNYCKASFKYSLNKLRT